MVETLYILILIPVLLYLFFSVLEIWLVYRIALRNHSRSLLFIQGSTELTHTLLVFAYAQFMVTFSSLLIDIGGELYWPIALLMATLLLRGSTYLLLFYRERPPRWMYLVLLGTYLVGVTSLVWALLIVIPAIINKGLCARYHQHRSRTDCRLTCTRLCHDPDHCCLQECFCRSS
ncbi:hypothetical protein IPP92_05045 [Candidatus Saccharibacteria bacterium]|nr:MAG: hypothetical protein IPP92_05045 [Candidatus Saccharibacteria bacterium]